MAEPATILANEGLSERASQQHHPPMPVSRHSWKEDHLAPGQLHDDPVALENYREVIGELLKHQRSNLQTLLLENILSGQRVNIKGAVPNCHEMLTSIYQDLPPKGDKMTAAEI
ncbi:hypothetical protein MJO29_002690 [Puccinia striiformis f. sp. tritici]|nr:hypothetical protein MJO29_002690 [Puccinia striiformis f. sp. tritici]